MGFFFSLSTKRFSRDFTLYIVKAKVSLFKSILICNDIFLSHYVGIQCSLLLIPFMIDYKHQDNLDRR